MLSVQTHNFLASETTCQTPDLASLLSDRSMRYSNLPRNFMITRSNRSKGMTQPELQGGQTALSRSKVLDQHKLISNPLTRGCNDSLHFLLQVFLLSCHSPPSTEVSTVSVWHGFIMYFTVILAWSILHIHTHHLHLHILLSRLLTLAQLNPFTCLLLEPQIVEGTIQI